jgi:hypothetical protein
MCYSLAGCDHDDEFEPNDERQSGPNGSDDIAVLLAKLALAIITNDDRAVVFCKLRHICLLD